MVGILFSYWGGLFAGAMVVSGISNPLLKARFLPRKWPAFFDGFYYYLPPRSFYNPLTRPAISWVGSK